MLFSGLQGLIEISLFVIFAGLKLWAIIDCVRRPQQAFPAVGRQSKLLWVILTGIAALVQLAFWEPISLLNIAGIVVALIYLFDIRIKITEITR